MENKKIVNELLKLHGCYYVVDYNDLNEEFYNRLEESNLTVEAIDSSFNVLSSYISEQFESDEDFRKSLLDETFETVDKIIKYSKMVQGYQEMSHINSTISQEDMHLEIEGANLGYDKVDTKKTKGEAK